eukprot:g16243.t1
MAVERDEQQQQAPGGKLPAPRCRDVDGTVLPLLGGLARYQKKILLLTWIPAVLIGLSRSSDCFFTAEPQIVCWTNRSSSRPLAAADVHIAHAQVAANQSGGAAGGSGG